jgi:aryl-alcohol dehydrogenase
MEITAAVAVHPYTDFEFDKLQLADPRPDEVLVEVEAVGLCHTDIGARDGALPIELPAVLGHEGSGTVVSVGVDVTKVAPGDRVVMSFNSCGECAACVEGAPAYCHQFMTLNYSGARSDGSAVLSRGTATIRGNFFGQSSFASHALVRARNLVKVSTDTPSEILAPLGRGVQTGAGAVMRSLAVRPGSSLVVIGGGSVGLSAAMAGVIVGCKDIVVIEPHASRRALACELGATSTIDPAGLVVAEELLAVVPAGVDYAIDTSGVPEAIGPVLECMGHRGKLGLIGVPVNPSAALPVGITSALILGLTIVGIVEGDSVPDEFIPELIDLHRQGKLPIDKMITVVPFSEINAAVALHQRGEAVKVVLTMS